MKGIFSIKRCLFLGVLFVCFVMSLNWWGAIQHDFSKSFMKHIEQPFVVRQEIPRDVDKHRGIPKIIHQIWNDDVIPAVFHDNIRGLVTHNKPPNWTYLFWTVQTGQQFIKDKFPGLYPRYSRADNLLKSDILRLAVLYQYGGAYFDLDTVSVKPLDPYVDTHDCSLVTDPPEHTLNVDKPKPKLMITNSAIVCKPSNWFILHVIKELENQPASCRDAVSCTGPLFISKHYELLQATNRSTDLPIIDDFRYFEDKFDPDQVPNLNKHCKEPLSALPYEWIREICRNWIARGREHRQISEKAFTYHTWFHTYYSRNKRKLQTGVKKRIRELVANVTFYPLT